MSFLDSLVFSTGKPSLAEERFRIGFQLSSSEVQAISQFKLAQDEAVKLAQGEIEGIGEGPYYGPISGGYTTLFEGAGNGEYAVRVVNALTKAELCLPQLRRICDIEVATHVFEAPLVEYKDFVKDESHVNYSMSDTSLGTTYVVALATGAVKDFTDYNSW